MNISYVTIFGLGWSVGTIVMWVYFKSSGLIRTKEEFMEHYL